MITITAPTSTILKGGALRDYAIDLFSNYSGIIRDKVGDNTIYKNVPLKATITMNEVQSILAVGGEIEGLPTYFKVTDLSLQIPVGLPYSTYTDENNEVIQKTFQELETSSQEWTLCNDGDYFIGTQSLLNGVNVLKGSECKQYLDSGITVLSTSELKPFLVTNEVL